MAWERDIKVNALVLSVETACRIGNAVYPDHYDVGWHITGTADVFGSAAAVGERRHAAQGKIEGDPHQRYTEDSDECGRTVEAGFRQREAATLLSQQVAARRSDVVECKLGHQMGLVTHGLNRELKNDSVLWPFDRDHRNIPVGRPRRRRPTNHAEQIGAFSILPGRR